MKFIDSKTHGILDYMSGVLFIASPWLFNFSNQDTAMLIPIIVGLMIIVLSAMTNYELGLIHAIPLNVHLTIDVLTGLFLMASPWIFDFADIVMWPHVIFGALEVGAGVFTFKRVQNPELR